MTTQPGPSPISIADVGGLSNDRDFWDGCGGTALRPDAGGRKFYLQAVDHPERRHLQEPRTTGICERSD